MDITDLSFIEREKITNIVDEDIKFERALEILCIEEQEVLYVLNKKEALIGVITIGDLDNYYYSMTYSFVNRNFKYIESLEDNSAYDVLRRFKSIHQVPVINNGKFNGIVQSNEKKENDEWIKMREHFYEITSLDKIKQFYLKQAKFVFPKLKQLGVDVWLIDFPSKVRKSIFRHPMFVTKNKRASNMSGFMQMTEREQEDFYKEDFYPDKAKEFAKSYNQIKSNINRGRILIADLDNNSFHARGGHRVVPNVPHNAKQKIYLIGSCNVLGAYVNDDRTIGFYLQEIINKIYKNQYEVVISANIGISDLSSLYCEEYKSGDVVISFMMNPNLHNEIIEYAISNKYAKKISIDKAYDFTADEELIGNLFNGILHHNHVINSRIAECIMNQINLRIVFNEAVRRPIQDYYIRYEIVDYYERLRRNNDCLIDNTGKIGAIVMNCNPFTYGHRYLIEYALGKVDMLYIFVVEEDKSIFTFEERFQMVKCGVSHLKNVEVIPSGRYVISNETFAQYFNKDNMIEEIEDMNYDVHIFGEVVCPIFGITQRFVGEELSDRVTKAYNETMKKVLPDYGVDLIEIPRLKLDNREVVSATKVRDLLKIYDWKKIEQLVPTSTVKILKNKIHG